MIVGVLNVVFLILLAYLLGKGWNILLKFIKWVDNSWSSSHLSSNMSGLNNLKTLIFYESSDVPNWSLEDSGLLIQKRLQGICLFSLIPPVNKIVRFEFLLYPC